MNRSARDGTLAIMHENGGIMEVFSERLKQMRKEHGISQTEMAGMLGLKLRAYQYYESGDHEPSLANLVIIADALHTSIDYLTGRVDQK